MDLQKLILNEKATIVDVREAWEFFMGHVPGSVNIPLGQIPQKMEELRQMNKPLVLICASGNRSGQATAFLKAQGFDQVFNGGGWRDVAELVRQAA